MFKKLHFELLVAALLQVVDDVLDFTGSALALGKPALNDLKSGLATAPVLFAAEVCPDCLTLSLD